MLKNVRIYFIFKKDNCKWLNKVKRFMMYTQVRALSCKEIYRLMLFLNQFLSSYITVTISPCSRKE